jgi:hypothetical protein
MNFCLKKENTGYDNHHYGKDFDNSIEYFNIGNVHDIGIGVDKNDVGQHRENKP